MQVDENPVTVTVEHLRDMKYDAGSDIVKATVMEAVATMKDLMRLNPLYKEHIAMFVQVRGCESGFEHLPDCVLQMHPYTTDCSLGATLSRDQLPCV